MADQDEVDEVDIELFAKAGKAPPKAKLYKFRVGKEQCQSEKAQVTGEEILILAKKTPAKDYILMQIKNGQQAQQVALDKVVDLSEPGLEKFKTLPRDQTEG